VHGNIYDYLQNRNLNGIDVASARQGILTNPRYDQNRLGATIGGPVIKNKLFYFGNFEYNPVGQASVPSAGVFSPTAQGYSLLSGIPSISQTNLGILKQYAAPAPVASDTTTVAGVKIPIGILPIVAPNFQNNYYSVASVDYNLRDKDQIRGRFIYNKQSAIDNNPTLPAFFLLNPTTNWLVNISEFHNFNPNLLNELRLGYNRYNNTTNTGDFKFPGLDQFPNIQIDQDLNLQIGPDPNGPQFTIQNFYQGVDNLTWTKGSHTFKFGFEGRKYISPQLFVQRSRGDYNYGLLERYLLDLTPDDLGERSFAPGGGVPIYYGDQVALYSYVNDTWRIRPNFSINLGLRHEYTTIPYSERLQKINNLASVPGLITFGEPKAQTKNFAPRVGIAWSPGSAGLTSIRAGFGMAYDVLYDNIGILSLPPQFTATVDVEGDAPNFLKNGGIKTTGGDLPTTPAAARALTSNYIPDQKLPYSIQWNFGIQHVFHKDYTVEARYVGTRGVHLNVQDRINVINRVTPTDFIPTFLTPPTADQLQALTRTEADIARKPRIDPRYAAVGLTSNIVAFLPIGNSTYHGLALQVNRRFTNGLQFVGAYTWSHNIDNSTADFFSTVITPRRPQDFQNFAIDKAASALDRRHRFTYSTIYDVPWFRHSNWFMKNLVGNLEVAATYITETPEYGTVQSGLDSNLNGDTAGDRTIINPNGVKGVGSDVYGLDRAGARISPTDSKNVGRVVAYVAQNPNAQYIRAGLGAFATGGRNTLPLRGINNWDISFIKRFSFTETKKFEFQGVFYNAFNHPQFVPGALDNINSISRTATRNYLIPGNATFNNPESAFGSNPRTIQLVAKFIF
jgi:hypothetical protein